MSGDWLDDIDGIKDIYDATSGVPVLQPRYAKLVVKGNGVELVPDPVTEATEFRIQGTPAFTPIKTASYAAQYGEFVRMGAGGGTVTLPPASAKKNGQVGVINVAGASVSVAPTGVNTINNSTSPYAINTLGYSVILQSDGVNAWWIVARST